MTDGPLAPRRMAPHGIVRSDLAPHGSGPANLADILERVLDKGIVIAGDIQVNLLDIELLTIKIRLLVASVDRAKEMGINWWESDPTLSTAAAEREQENETLRQRIDRLEERLSLVAATDHPSPEGERVELTEKRTTVERPDGRRTTAQRRVARERKK